MALRAYNNNEEEFAGVEYQPGRFLGYRLFKTGAQFINMIETAGDSPSAKIFKRGYSKSPREFMCAWGARGCVKGELTPARVWAHVVPLEDTVAVVGLVDTAFLIPTCLACNNVNKQDVVFELPSDAFLIEVNMKPWWEAGKKEKRVNAIKHISRNLPTNGKVRTLIKKLKSDLKGDAENIETLDKLLKELNLNETLTE